MLRLPLLYFLRVRRHGFARAVLTLFALVWLGAMVPPCARADSHSAVHDMADHHGGHPADAIGHADLDCLEHGVPAGGKPAPPPCEPCPDGVCALWSNIPTQQASIPSAPAPDIFKFALPPDASWRWTATSGRPTGPPVPYILSVPLPVSRVLEFRVLLI